MKRLKAFFILSLFLLLASCRVGPNNGKILPPENSNYVGQDPEISYENFEDAYLEIMTEENDKQIKADYYGHLRNLGRANLYDLNEDGQEELVYVYQGANDMLHCAMWTFEEKKPVLIVDKELISMNDMGTGGINAVEFEGNRYFCSWGYNSATWEPGEANIYYDCFLWEYPQSDQEPPYSQPSHTFKFRYYLRENGEIRLDAFSFLEDDYIALSVDEFQKLKEILIDNPTQVLCEADIINSEGLSFEQMIAKLQ